MYESESEKLWEEIWHMKIEAGEKTKITLKWKNASVQLLGYLVKYAGWKPCNKKGHVMIGYKLSCWVRKDQWESRSWNTKTFLWRQRANNECNVLSIDVWLWKLDEEILGESR